MITVYGIPNCDTVKKARTWLNERGIEHQFHDYKKQGVPEAELDQWLADLGWELLVNRKGTTWSKLDETAREQVTNATSARTLMLRQPSVIKRPVVRWNKSNPTPLTVGFDPAEWQRRIGDSLHLDRAPHAVRLVADLKSQIRIHSPNRP